MSKKVGDLVYGPDEALHEGIPHKTADEPEISLYAIDADEDSTEEEATFVANRIKELLDGTHTVRQGDKFRPICPEDIVILLRSPGSKGAVYAKALAKCGVRCSFGGSVNILKTEEVQTLRAILQVIDNPLQDIPLVTVLASRVFGFTADELAYIRSQHGGSIYRAISASDMPKAVAFVETLKKLREISRLCTLPQLIQEIFYETEIDSIYASMVDGKMRTENLQGFCQLVSGFDAGGVRSLDRFLVHLEGLDEKGVSGLGEDTSSGAVTLMSIHKSKGLEFPVVFLCGLSTKFNMESAYEQVLCHKKLGLGLYCVDVDNRVRYPSICKRAISNQILSESLSEELRVLYVAMTRPKDRLIMTYTSKNIEGKIADLVNRMDLSDPLLMTSEVNCPGKWILLAALRRTEAGALFKLGGYPQYTEVSKSPWDIQVVKADDPMVGSINEESNLSEGVSNALVDRLRDSLVFRYPYEDATKIPSKQTATQLKGRMKDSEAAQNAGEPAVIYRSWRKPAFVSKTVSGKDYGNAIHAVMQYICYGECTSRADIEKEIQRLQLDGYISQEQASMVDVDAIYSFFCTDIGKRLSAGVEVLREFKFSVLEDAGKYCSGVSEEKILLQGVVDCALIDSDGITVLDFKTDHVTDETLAGTVDGYRQQVKIYADALERIYQMPIKETCLYFFSNTQMVLL